MSNLDNVTGNDERPDDERPAAVAAAMIVDGVPHEAVVAYLHLATVFEAGVDPWDRDVFP